MCGGGEPRKGSYLPHGGCSGVWGCARGGDTHLGAAHGEDSPTEGYPRGHTLTWGMPIRGTTIFGISPPTHPRGDAHGGDTHPGDAHGGAAPHRGSARPEHRAGTCGGGARGRFFRGGEGEKSRQGWVGRRGEEGAEAPHLRRGSAGGQTRKI